MHNFNFHNYPVSFLFVISAVHHSIVELSSFLPLGDGLEIAKLIVQDQTMQDSPGTYPPLDAIGQTLCSLIVSSDRKGDVLNWPLPEIHGHPGIISVNYLRVRLRRIEWQAFIE